MIVQFWDLVSPAGAADTPTALLEYPGCVLLSVQGWRALVKPSLGGISRRSFVISSVFSKHQRYRNCGDLLKGLRVPELGLVCARGPFCSTGCLWGRCEVPTSALALWGWDVAEIYLLISGARS